MDMAKGKWGPGWGKGEMRPRLKQARVAKGPPHAAAAFGSESAPPPFGFIHSSLSNESKEKLSPPPICRGRARSIPRGPSRPADPSHTSTAKASNQWSGRKEYGAGNRAKMHAPAAASSRLGGALRVTGLVLAPGWGSDDAAVLRTVCVDHDDQKAAIRSSARTT